MNKIEYGSLYKFFVSLGVIFLFLPFICFFFLINLDITIIDQNQVATLSDYSINSIKRKESLLTFCFDNFHLVSTILFCIGFLSIFFGITKWWKNQSNEDAILNAEKAKKEIELQQMEPSEIISKAAKETSESKKDDESNSPDIEKKSSTVVEERSHLHMNRIMNYLQAEEHYFNSILSKKPSLARRHFFQRNIRIGSYEYDAIAISKMDNIDLIFELKYWENSPSIKMIEVVLHRLYLSGLNYKEKQNRLCKIQLSIISPSTTRHSTLSKIKNYIQAHKEEHDIPIIVDFIDIESLKR